MTSSGPGNLKKVLIKAAVIARVPRELKELGAGSRILLVGDRNTCRAAGERVAAALGGAGFQVDLCVLHRDGVLRADERALGEISAALEPDCGFLLAVGSGTVNDLTRYVAYRTGRPYAVVATAPSMDGYASAVAALTVRGCKKSFPAVPPLAVFGDLTILRNAPPAMIGAGFGDLLGKYTALADWQLGHVIEGEDFCSAIEASVRRAVDQCSNALEGRDEKKYVQSLTGALIESGLAMLRWGGSRPASGAEHHISHYLEMGEARGECAYHLHGTKVGVAEVYVTAIYHNIFRHDAQSVREIMNRRRSETAAAREERIRDAYGSQAQEILTEQGGYYLDEAVRRNRQKAILANWDFLRDWVKRNVPLPGRVRELLAAAGAPSSLAALDLAGPVIKTVLRNAKEVRRSYTVFRLAEDLGLAPEDLVFDAAQG